jgi:Putative MetA-pathway of phenol degradation
MSRGLGILAIAAALHGGAARAQELPPELGRYMPLYPGLYVDAGFAQDERDRSFDRNGHSQASATPQAPGGRTAMPEDRGFATFTWHFPAFESYAIPFISDRTYLARMTLRYADTRTEGALKDFIDDDSDDARSEADGLKNNGSGVGDLTLELGSFLAGSRDWRTRERSPFALLLVAGVNVPTGVYEREGPNSAGTNTWWFQGRLGLHWQPWDGGYVDAGAAYRDYLNTDEAMFGGLAPFKQGDDRFYDVGYSQRLWRDLYAGMTFGFRYGDANVYRDPQYAPNAPPHPDSNTDTYPTPGHYRDDGTEIKTRTSSLYWFITQRWLAALHYTHPQDGRSGQFLLPFSTRSPTGCTPGAVGCTVGTGQTVLVDGMGPARAFSTEYLTLTITHNFGLGDTFSCRGCER